MAANAPNKSFYWSAAWRTVRAAALRARPVCEVAGCRERASHVDHIQTRRQRPDLALEPSNLQALCHAHHSAKTVGQDGGFGRARGGAAVLRVRGCDADGRPLDPGHHWNKGES